MEVLTSSLPERVHRRSDAPSVSRETGRFDAPCGYRNALMMLLASTILMIIAAQAPPRYRPASCTVDGKGCGGAYACHPLVWRQNTL